MNDPMEGEHSLSRMLRDSGEAKTVARKFRKSMAKIGIASFSEIYDHELMWAHYADQFRGICIAYHFLRLRQSLPDGVEFVRMYYNEKNPTVGRTRKTADQIARRVLSYKNHRWLYEREWRMFGPQGKVKYSKATCTPRVYMGYRIDPHERQKIERALRPLKIETVNDEY
jgi:hypothetical protein